MSNETQHQITRVKMLMSDGEWRTAGAILDMIGREGEESAAITARLRDLRKARHDAYLVECRLRGGGDGRVYEYRLGEKGGNRPAVRARRGVRAFTMDLEVHLREREAAGAAREGDTAADGAREGLALVILDFLDGWSK